MPVWANPIPLFSVRCKLSLCLKIARKNCSMLMGDTLCCSSRACTDSGQGLGATEGCKNHHHPGKPSAAVQANFLGSEIDFLWGRQNCPWGGGGCPWIPLIFRVFPLKQFSCLFAKFLAQNPCCGYKRNKQKTVLKFFGFIHI